MLILGKHTDDKGKQLETLTLRLLQELKYKNCSTNLISAGGSEIDVIGEYEIPGPIAQRIVRELICECKAHRSPIGMTDWQKFLGKVFSEEIIRDHEVSGCFVALSGVNGNVKGHFDNIKGKRDNITLLCGDDLLEMLSAVYGLLSFEAISQHVSKRTSRVVTRIEPAYYESECYWVVLFASGEFTVVLGDGSHFDENSSPTVIELMQNQIESSDFIDLKAETEALIRHKQTMSYCLCELMVRGGTVASFGSLKGYEFTEQEIEAALNELKEKQVIEFDEESDRYSIPVDDKDGVPHVKLNYYRAMLEAGPVLEALGCEFYDKHINSALLDEILDKQRGIPLDDADTKTVLEFLRLSPSALIRCSKPIDMIVTHRNEQPIDDMTNRADRDYLIQLLQRTLAIDFQQRVLAPYFYEGRNVRELETTTTAKVKGHEGLIVDNTITERHALCQAADELGGGFVHVLLYPEIPEPWEEGGMGGPKTTDDAKVDDNFKDAIADPTVSRST